MNNLKIFLLTIFLFFSSSLLSCDYPVKRPIPNALDMNIDFAASYLVSKKWIDDIGRYMDCLDVEANAALISVGSENMVTIGTIYDQKASIISRRDNYYNDAFDDREEYVTKLNEQVRIYRESPERKKIIAARKEGKIKEEQDRIARTEKEEQNRIAKAKKEEQDRIAKAKKEEQDRLDREERIRQERLDREERVKQERQESETKLFKSGSGSGFAVTKNGHLITNYHVIQGCKDVKIRFDGDELPTKTLAFDLANDLALLKASFIPPRILGISELNPRLLDDVYVAGFPFGDMFSTSIKVTKGIVSSLTGMGNNFSNIQIDAALQPGNSGGPIINNNGVVVGVAVAKLDSLLLLEKSGSLPENTNFGIKSSILINFLESNRVKFTKQSEGKTNNSNLGELLIDATFFVSCEMTSAQIEEMQSEKVMYKKFMK